MENQKAPELIDELVHPENPALHNRTEIGRRWVIAKPVQQLPWPTRLWHAWLVLRGKAHTYEYAVERLARQQTERRIDLRYR